MDDKSIKFSINLANFRKVFKLLITTAQLGYLIVKAAQSQAKTRVPSEDFLYEL